MAIINQLELIILAWQSFSMLTYFNDTAPDFYF